LHLKITAAEVEAIDDWRFAKRMPSRSEAVRRLCSIGLSFESRAPTILKRNERALKAIILTLERISPAQATALPQGTRGGLVAAMEEQLAAYREAAAAYLSAEVMADYPDEESDELLKEAQALISILRNGEEKS